MSTLTSITPLARIAFHEAGHAIVSMAFGHTPAMLWIDPERGGCCIPGLSKRAWTARQKLIFFAAGNAGEIFHIYTSSDKRERLYRELAATPKPQRVMPSLPVTSSVEQQRAQFRQDAYDVHGKGLGDFGEFVRIEGNGGESFARRRHDAKRILYDNIKQTRRLAVALLKYRSLWRQDILDAVHNKLL